MYIWWAQSPQPAHLYILLYTTACHSSNLATNCSITRSSQMILQPPAPFEHPSNRSLQPPAPSHIHFCESCACRHHRTPISSALHLHVSSHIHFIGSNRFLHNFMPIHPLLTKKLYHHPVPNSFPLPDAISCPSSAKASIVTS